jgi:hypothetical protein
VIKRATAGRKVEVIGPDFYARLKGGERGEIVSIFASGKPRTTFGPFVYIKLDDGRNSHTHRSNLRGAK